MKKLFSIFLLVALIASTRTVALANPDKDVGYSLPQIEKQSIIYDLFDLNVTMIAPVMPDVGNVVTVHYDVKTPVVENPAEVPVNDLLIASPQNMRSRSYITHKYRRQVTEINKYIRPPDKQQAQLE